MVWEQTAQSYACVLRSKPHCHDSVDRTASPSPPMQSVTRVECAWYFAGIRPETSVKKKNFWVSSSRTRPSRSPQWVSSDLDQLFCWCNSEENKRGGQDLVHAGATKIHSSFSHFVSCSSHPIRVRAPIPEAGSPGD